MPSGALACHHGPTEGDRVNELPWPALLGAVISIIGGLAALVFWLVRKLVAAAEKRADQIIQTITKAADERTREADARAAEWKATSGSWETAYRQQAGIAEKAVESNKITDHFFDVYMPHRGAAGENVVTEG